MIQPDLKWYIHLRRSIFSETVQVDASAESNAANGGTQMIWTNMERFNTLKAQIAGTLELPTTLPGRPSYVPRTKIGISEGNVALKLEKRDISKLEYQLKVSHKYILFLRYQQLNADRVRLDPVKISLTSTKVGSMILVYEDKYFIYV